MGFEGQRPNANHTSPTNLGSPHGTVSPILETPPSQSEIQPPAKSGEEAGCLSNRHMPKVLTTPLLITAMAQDGPSLPTLLPRQAPFGSQNLQNPLSKAEGKLMCSRPDCGDKTFKWPSDLQTHMNKHTRPFRCPIRDCPRPKSGFATKGVLDRHMKRVHGVSCSTSAAPLAVAVENGSVDLEQGEMMLEVMPGSVVVRAKGKGRAKRSLTSSSSVGESGEEEEGTTLASSAKKAKIIEQRSSGSQQASQREEELVKENETLRQQLDRANEQSERYHQEREKERDVLLGIIAESQSKQGK
ncbi:hypothetical protein BDZ45DRAFT_128783 [Acephala macrosclerotiorum]|nr:hypothetical protein BDZ45DRAFT_128783 [Acephala macrosclerotiorum]